MTRCNRYQWWYLLWPEPLPRVARQCPALDACMHAALRVRASASRDVELTDAQASAECANRVSCDNRGVLLHSRVIWLQEFGDHAELLAAWLASLNPGQLMNEVERAGGIVQAAVKSDKGSVHTVSLHRDKHMHLPLSMQSLSNSSVLPNGHQH